MAISTWLSNNKIETAFVEYKGHSFLVYTRMVGSHSVEMVEHVKTGVRVFPDKHPMIDSGSAMDNLVHELMDNFIQNHLSTNV